MEPFGEWIADQRFGEIAALIANVNRDSKRRPNAYEAADFIPWRERRQRQPEKAPTPEAHSQLLVRRLFPGSIRAKSRGK